MSQIMKRDTQIISWLHKCINIYVYIYTKTYAQQQKTVKTLFSINFKMHVASTNSARLLLQKGNLISFIVKVSPATNAEKKHAEIATDLPRTWRCMKAQGQVYQFLYGVI